MFVDYTDHQKALRKEFRNYFTSLVKPEYREELRNAESGELYKKLIRQQGDDGMLAIGWPKEYGGRGLTESEQLIRYEEALLAGAPTPFVTLNTVGPAIMSKGTEEQKQRFLPGIASGELHFAIGYTEPNAGTDLAALTTSAVKSGDHYVVNGNKVFTSGAEGADYIFLAVRTDPEAKKHKGISILVSDTKDPGFSYGPIHTMGGVRTNVTYYTDVKVPVDMIIGEENGGWRLITEQLNHERVGLAAWGIQGWKIFRDAMDWARNTKNADALDACKTQNETLKLLLAKDGGVPVLSDEKVDRLERTLKVDTPQRITLWSAEGSAVAHDTYGHTHSPSRLLGAHRRDARLHG